MNNVDKQYIELAKEIIEYGNFKKTRSGNVYSLFGKSMRFDLSEGLPLLTTKRVYVKGIIHELIWFLSGNTNIKYLVENNVHIWDDDAYRYYSELYDLKLELSKTIEYDSELKSKATKEEFLDRVMNGKTASMMKKDGDDIVVFKYRYGDLGKIYGTQWRNQGEKHIDQISKLVETLKNNPDDRRMLCMAWNSNDLSDMALPPCHYGFQLYTRKLDNNERLQWLWNHSNGEYDEWKFASHETLDGLNVPKLELSLMYNMRSNDFCCGQPYNTAEYAMLVYMLCEVCNMSPGEVIFNGGDVHIYENHLDGIKEQITRNGSDELPTLRFKRKVNDIFDFKYDDFIIEGYNPDPPIKFNLNVG